VGDGFQERFVEALRQRLYPNASLHLKQIAAGIGRSENTVARWWRGETRILAEDLYRIARFFLHRGDREFLRAIFSESLSQSTASEIEDQLVLLVRSSLAQLSAARGTSLAWNLWFTAEGSMESSPFGHSAYVERALELPPDAGDLVAYAVRVLGWIAVTVLPDESIAIRHDGRRLAPLAAERACDWLRARADRTHLLERAIHIEGRWIEARHDGVDSAIAAISRLAFIVRNPRQHWTVTPLPIDSIGDGRLIELLHIHAAAPETIIHAAAAMGVLTVSSVFAVDGENVISHHVPTQFDLRGCLKIA
jgi:transcriptional regulator with XRE-family HTH domain